MKNMVHTRIQVTTYFKENIFAFFNAQNSLNVVDSAALITCSSKHNNEDDYAEEEAIGWRERRCTV